MKYERGWTSVFHPRVINNKDAGSIIDQDLFAGDSFQFKFILPFLHGYIYKVHVM
jgi:hypothetical protein